MMPSMLMKAIGQDPRSVWCKIQHAVLALPHTTIVKHDHYGNLLTLTYCPQEPMCTAPGAKGSLQGTVRAEYLNPLTS